MYRLAFAGYATVDIIENKRYFGGAAGTMSINAAYLGIRSFLISILSNDTSEQWYKKRLARAEVDTSFCIDAPHLPTCIIQNPYGKGSERIWSDNGANNFISTLIINTAIVNKFDGVFVVNSHPDLGEKIAQFSKRTLYYIPGPQALIQKGYIREKILSKSRIVFGNEEEAPFIFDKKPFSSGVEMVVITHGKKGGEIFLRNGHIIQFEAPEVKKVIDTTGAGDSFALGFVLGILDNKTLDDAVINGKKLAKKVLAQKGGLIFTYL